MPKFVDDIEVKSSPTEEGTTRTVADTDGNLYQGGTKIAADAAEINRLDGVTAGTVAAGKVLVPDSNKRLDTLVIGDLKLGSGAGTSVSPTAAQINLLVQGVAFGYKLARGTHSPASGSDTVVTGLSTVVAAVASLKGAPTLTCMFVVADTGDQDGAPAAGSILLKTYKPTTSGDVTPIAATTPWPDIDWIAIGT